MTARRGQLLRTAPSKMCFGHVWTTPWQEFSTLLQIGRVRSAYLPTFFTLPLVTPIALYPDTLLSQVLSASAVRAGGRSGDRWVKTTTLKGDQLKAAVDKQGWDDSGRYP